MRWKWGKKEREKKDGGQQRERARKGRKIGKKEEGGRKKGGKAREKHALLEV